jgi:hypothetical protein
LVVGISESVSRGDLGGLAPVLIVAVALVVGWLLLTSRPRIGAAVIGTIAAAVRVIAVISLSNVSSAANAFRTPNEMIFEVVGSLRD